LFSYFKENTRTGEEQVLGRNEERQESDAIFEVDAVPTHNDASGLNDSSPTKGQKSAGGDMCDVLLKATVAGVAATAATPAVASVALASVGFTSSGNVYCSGYTLYSLTFVFVLYPF
jgi:hypothetical protein